MTEPDAVEPAVPESLARPATPVPGMDQVRLPTPRMGWPMPVSRPRMPRVAIAPEQVKAALVPLAAVMRQIAETLAAVFPPPPQAHRRLAPISSRYDYRQRVRNRRRRRKNKRTTR